MSSGRSLHQLNLGVQSEIQRNSHKTTAVGFLQHENILTRAWFEPANFWCRRPATNQSRPPAGQSMTKVSAADKGCRVYPLDTHPDAVSPYSACNPDPSRLCLGKRLVLSKLNVDQVSLNTRFLITSFPNNEMSKVSPFAIQKALMGKGGEPKSPSTSSTVAPVSEPQPPIPVSCDLLSTTEIMFSPIEASLAMSASSSNSSNQPPSTSTINQSIKMAQHKLNKPAPVEYTTDEDNMIVYDAEEEIESNPEIVKKMGNRITRDRYF
ncbi:hypothetical protein TNCV_1494771 [Trichonephila clavipes]|nr:hypothetical protein TNCV_1494771 [Trichonephila clavipes]